MGSLEPSEKEIEKEQLKEEQEEKERKKKEEQLKKEQVIKFSEDTHKGIEVALLNADKWHYVSATFFLTKDGMCIKSNDRDHYYSMAEVQGVYNFLEASNTWDQLSTCIAPGDRSRAI